MLGPLFKKLWNRLVDLDSLINRCQSHLFIFPCVPNLAHKAKS